MSFPTIAAIATPPGLGGIGIVRISGADAERIARTLAPNLPQTTESHRLYIRTLRSPVDGAVLDNALVVCMRAPHSYTGEDVVELQCHGSPVNLRRVLDAVLVAGARPAEPGEFTRRAFLNNQLDLVQAEAVADLIEAKSEAACRLASRHLEGRLSREIGSLSRSLTDVLTLIEAGIDFSLEEHVYEVDRPAQRAQLALAGNKVTELLGSYDRGRRLREGIRCVIVGRPNSGKSTLLNRLLQEERVIVSPSPGTTRDYVDAELVIGGHLFVLVDTAGIRESEDAIEEEGVRRSIRLASSADLPIVVADSSQSDSDVDAELVRTLARPGIFLWNKIDLPQRTVAPELPDDWIGPVAVQLTDPTSLDVVLDALRQAVEGAGTSATAESATLSRARHRDALERARDHLEASIGALDQSLDLELVALDLRLALDAIGEVVGRVTPDEILGQIFSKFCVGK